MTPTDIKPSSTRRAIRVIRRSCGSDRDWRRLMARYLKVPDRDSFQVDHVALQLFSSGDGARGNVNSPSSLNQAIPTTFEPDLPATEAAQRATDHADQLSTDVEV